MNCVILHYSSVRLTPDSTFPIHTANSSLLNKATDWCKFQTLQRKILDTKLKSLKNIDDAVTALIKSIQSTAWASVPLSSNQHKSTFSLNIPSQ